MALKTYTGLLTPGFVVDQGSVSLSTGRQIDWEALASDADYADHIPAGTIMQDGADGKVKPLASGGTPVGILVTRANRVSRSDSVTGYGMYVGGVFYSTLMPNFTSAAATALGPRYVFETYTDSRAQ